ncbi:MAG: helix-turn-helix transcriptional regulator [Rickettsiaceae bacterium]|nr:helix-turn-helix transcriptional regulator [Rickettsiaceae bacterium]
MSDQKGRADNIDKLVSRKLKMRRIMLGLSQEEVGQAIDVSIQQIQKYEKAKNRIASGKLFTLSKFLQVPINYFFDHSNDNNEIIKTVFAEESEEYTVNDEEVVSEKEIINLIKFFSEIKNHQTRKKIVELIKSMIA